MGGPTAIKSSIRSESGFSNESKANRNPVSGEAVETLAKGVLAQPADAIDRMKKLIGK
jgi:hypothetical protein